MLASVATATSDGYELWYEARGDGPTIVLTGGFGLLHDQFERVAPTLAESFRTVSWNWRGAGCSDRALTAELSVEAWTRDLAAVLEAAGVERAALWGTSTGALVSIHFAARHPDLTSALITYPSYKTDVASRRAYELFAEVAEVFGFEAVTRLVSWVGLPPEKLETSEGIAFARWERDALERNLPIEAWGPVCRAIAMTDLTSDLERIADADIPVLLLAGNAGPVGVDAGPIKAQLDEFHRRVPRARAQIVPGTGGTYCVLEDAEACLAAARSFLAEAAPD